MCDVPWQFMTSTDIERGSNVHKTRTGKEQRRNRAQPNSLVAQRCFEAYKVGPFPAISRLLGGGPSTFPLGLSVCASCNPPEPGASGPHL